MKHIDYIMKFHKKYDIELIQEISMDDKPIFYYPGDVRYGGSDGIIVKVIPSDHESWTGIFAFDKLLYNAKNGIYSFPNPNKFSVSYIAKNCISYAHQCSTFLYCHFVVIRHSHR